MEFACVADIGPMGVNRGQRSDAQGLCACMCMCVFMCMHVHMYMPKSVPSQSIM